MPAALPSTSTFPRQPSALEREALEAVYLDGQGLDQRDIDLMGFFDEIPSMRVVTLPRNETGQVGDCPLARVRCH